MSEQRRHVRQWQIGFRIDSISNMWKNSQSSLTSNDITNTGVKFCFYRISDARKLPRTSKQPFPGERLAAEMSLEENMKNMLTATTQQA